MNIIKLVLVDRLPVSRYNHRRRLFFHHPSMRATFFLVSGQVIQVHKRLPTFTSGQLVLVDGLLVSQQDVVSVKGFPTLAGKTWRAVNKVLMSLAVLVISEHPPALTTLQGIGLGLGTCGCIGTILLE